MEGETLNLDNTSHTFNTHSLLLWMEKAIVVSFDAFFPLLYIFWLSLADIYSTVKKTQVISILDTCSKW